MTCVTREGDLQAGALSREHARSRGGVATEFADERTRVVTNSPRFNKNFFQNKKDPNVFLRSGQE